jgi:hypothetical protein
LADADLVAKREACREASRREVQINPRVPPGTAAYRRLIDRRNTFVKACMIKPMPKPQPKAAQPPQVRKRR